jgi:predicted acetyltransferase
MAIELLRATRDDASMLANVFQYYVYDMTEIVDLELGGDGRFVVPALDAWWTDARRHPHFIQLDGKVVGFALVQQGSRITGDDQTWNVAEFFVMRKYRRGGVGGAAAVRVFDAYRGTWEVRELASNHGGIAFWRRVIGIYTKGNFREEILDDARWRGPVQSFQN